MSTTYRVIMKGVRPGHAPERVAHRLAELFKMELAVLHDALCQGAFTIKRGVDLTTAARYQSSLEKRGCACLIEPEAEVPKPLPPVVVTATQPPNRITQWKRYLPAALAVVGMVVVAAYFLL